MSDQSDLRRRSLDRVRLSPSSQEQFSASFRASESLTPSARSLRIPEAGDSRLLRLRNQEYELEIERQRQEITVLRQQIDGSNQLHDREMREIKEFYDRKIEVQRQEFEQSVSTLQYKISDLTASLTSESDRSGRYRQELLLLKENYNEELEALQLKIEEVAGESDRLKRTTITQMQSEVSYLQTETETLKITREKDIDELKREQQSALIDLNSRLDNKESKIKALEFELQETKKQLKDSYVRHEKEIQGYQEALKSTRNIMETQEEDIKRLKLAREDARKDARELAKEVATLELEMKRVRKEKGLIELEAQKLERTIYGKSSRKFLSPRTKR